MDGMDGAADNNAAGHRLESRVVRYRDLRPCFNAFIDTRTPGSEAKENFTIIGPGVSENPEQFVHIAEPHGFNIGGARQPPGCVNSQHSHDTAEVFVVHSGTWQINIGERGDDAQIVIRPGDVASVPTGLFRGFTNIGEDSGFLWVVLGQDNPGRVLWAPYVFDMAKNYGLVLLESGKLIDTAAGESLPAGAVPMPRTSAQQVAAMRVPSAAELEAIVVRDDRGPGPVIGAAAPLAWDHGFTLTRHEIGSTTQFDARGNVLFVHRGALTIQAGGERVELGAGDTVTLPADLPDCAVTGDATVFAVQRA